MDKADKAVALGEDIFDAKMVDIRAEDVPVSIEERVAFVEQMLKQHTMSLDSLFAIVKEMRGKSENHAEQRQIDANINLNKSDEKIPVGTVLKGMTRGTPFWCVVKNDGFWVGATRYDSLSAAAGAVSGVRRSGWAFWRFDAGEYEGKTVKEVYRG